MGSVRSALSLALAALLLQPASAHAGWRLTFSDEFDGETLDTAKWKTSDFWGNQTLAGNAEKQCYMPESVKQVGGQLLLTASRPATPVSACKGAKTDLPFKSGMVTTAGCRSYEQSEACKQLNPFSQAYGYFEIRARLPKGKGLWPAFWLVPMDASWPPEIDIMEMLGHTPSIVYHTYHYFDAKGVRQKAGDANKSRDFSESFSTFGIDWRPGLLIWYVDGRESFRFAGPDVTSKDMYLLLNLAVGGHWPGDPDQATPFPSTMAVDYIRVYERINDGSPDEFPPSPASPGNSK
jgi:beta-glucanase (GH16 family)